MTTQLPTAGSGEMFDRIAPRYDLLNHLMSFGLATLWRRRLVRSIALPNDGRLLDLATGTGDVVVAAARRDTGARIVGLDPSAGMLEVAQSKLEAKRLGDRIELVVGDAQNLPFENNTFDAVTISFGIRNVPDRPKALREMARVVKPGGRVAILELTEPTRGPLAALARLHVHTIIPRLGAWLSGAREYRYLEASIAAFPTAEDFATVMIEAGLNPPTIIRLGFGSAHLFVSENGLD